MLGRRWFLIAGQVICFVGHMIISRASSGDMVIAGMAVDGFGAAMSQMAAFALPELLPNKWRHIGMQQTKYGLVRWMANRDNRRCHR